MIRNSVTVATHKWLKPSRIILNPVASRLGSHIESNCMSNVLQSAYDVTLNMDKKNKKFIFDPQK